MSDSKITKFTHCAVWCTLLNCLFFLNFSEMARSFIPTSKWSTLLWVVPISVFAPQKICGKFYNFFLFCEIMQWWKLFFVRFSNSKIIFKNCYRVFVWKITKLKGCSSEKVYWLPLKHILALPTQGQKYYVSEVKPSTCFSSDITFFKNRFNPFINLSSTEYWNFVFRKEHDQSWNIFCEKKVS